jgi:hypothetical protein
MNAMERRQYEMLVRVRDFGTTYVDLFPEASVARDNFAAVEAAIRELDAQEVAHSAASVAGRAQRNSAARQVLADRLNAIAQTARVIRQDDSNLLQQFEVPAPATDPALITTGRKFARDAEGLSSQFIAHGMPVTFIADLTALVDSFESALRDRGLGREHEGGGSGRHRRRPQPRRRCHQPSGRRFGHEGSVGARTANRLSQENQRAAGRDAGAGGRRTHAGFADGHQGRVNAMSGGPKRSALHSQT